jgi:hypothetical protein
MNLKYSRVFKEEQKMFIKVQQEQSDLKRTRMG